MTERRILPNRRACETFEIKHGEQLTRFVVTVGYFESDLLGPATPAEVFVTGAKVGSETEAIARDGAILLSLAMQYGIPLDTIARALTRDANGKPSTVIGAVVDRLA